MDTDRKRKIKVLRIIARLNVGGPAIHTILLTQGLNNSFFDSLLVTGKAGKGEKDMLYLAKEKSVKPIIIPQLQREINLIKDFIAFCKIFLLISKERPDIIHTHTSKAGALGRLAALLYNTFANKKKSTLIHTFHGTVLNAYFRRAKSNFFIRIERILAKFTDKIVTVSRVVREDLLALKIGNSEKVVVVPLGLDIGELLSLKPSNNGSVLKVGIVARLVPVKNHKMFLDGIKAFLDKQKVSSQAYRFFIIGDGELRDELGRYSLQLGIEDFVEFHSWHSRVAEVYSWLDIVVLTSLNEGTPLSLIEAMASARVTIATDVGGVRDLFLKTQDYGLKDFSRIRIFDNGILCKSGDIEGLAEALQLLSSRADLRAKMGNFGRVFVREKFSKERLISDMGLLYNNSLKKRSI